MKRGNFLRNRNDITLRPVKRLGSTKKLTHPDDFLPCKYCLGYYKKKSLNIPEYVRRITKKNNNKRQTFRSDGQTTLLLHSVNKYDELLKSKVFPRIRADTIGLITKKDLLICKYAYSYIKGRQTKGNIDVVRQNMRRLAELLQYAQKNNEGIQKLEDILRP